ncbi:hypothetical protein NYE69_31370 [Paenibacillus sp. FSL R5-0527]|nr:hypothetical protein [Paenibacillus macerans]
MEPWKSSKADSRKINRKVQRAIDKGHGADSFSRLTQVFKHPSA